MPASIQNLYTQSRSLQAYTQALQATGKNIASSADPNYTRQQVNLQQALPAGIGSMLGSAVQATIKDTRDQLIESQVWREQSDLAHQNEHLAYLEQLELGLFAGSDDPLTVGAEGGDYLSRGLVTSISNFLSAWGNLEASPMDATAKGQVFSEAEALIDQFHRDASTLEGLGETVEAAVGASVEAVNRLLEQVASLQERISRLPTGSDAARMDLVAQRNGSLSELSEYIPFTWSSGADPLQSTLTVRLADGSQAALLSGAEVLDTLRWDGDTVRLAGAGSALATDRGRLGAQVRVLDDDLNRMQNHWNLLAGEMVRIVNNVYNADGTDGENFFDPETATAASIRLEVPRASAVRAGTGGNGNDIAANLARLATSNLGADHGSPLASSFAENLLSEQHRLASQIDRVRDGLSAQKKVVTFLEQERSNRSGVNLDQEVTHLLQFQRAFQASSRVLRALDETLETFLSDIR
jgi:flagellar hook-associated protein 1